MVVVWCYMVVVVKVWCLVEKKKNPIFTSASLYLS